jgi:hypothetical protein
MKSSIRPCFSSESARCAQRLSLKSRRANDLRLRTELVAWLPAMSEALRTELVGALRQRLVDRMTLAARAEAES